MFDKHTAIFINATRAVIIIIIMNINITIVSQVPRPTVGDIKLGQGW